MSWETENQTSEVIAKEILITLIEKGYLDTKLGETSAEIAGKMYNILLKTISKPSE